MSIQSADALTGIAGFKRATKPPKPRKCRCGCGESFVPCRPFQQAKTPACAIRLAEKKRSKEAEKQAKAERAEIRERKIALKPLQYWAKRAERAVNAYCLAAEAQCGCISCGTFDAQAYHAGHFISVGASSALRFDPANIHKQCSKCNIHLGGNQAEYRRRLPARIGQAEVDRLDHAKRERKWTREECQQIEAEFKAKLKGLSR